MSWTLPKCLISTHKCPVFTDAGHLPADLSQHVLRGPGIIRLQHYSSMQYSNTSGGGETLYSNHELYINFLWHHIYQPLMGHASPLKGEILTHFFIQETSQNGVNMAWGMAKQVLQGLEAGPLWINRSKALLLIKMKYIFVNKYMSLSYAMHHALLVMPETGELFYGRVYTLSLSKNYAQIIQKGKNHFLQWNVHLSYLYLCLNVWKLCISIACPVYSDSCWRPKMPLLYECSRD